MYDSFTCLPFPDNTMLLGTWLPSYCVEVVVELIRIDSNKTLNRLHGFCKFRMLLQIDGHLQQQQRTARLHRENQYPMPSIIILIQTPRVQTVVAQAGGMRCTRQTTIRAAHDTFDDNVNIQPIARLRHPPTCACTNKQWHNILPRTRHESKSLESHNFFCHVVTMPAATTNYDTLLFHRILAIAVLLSALS